MAVFTTLIDYVLWLIGFKSFEPTESRRLGYQYHPGLRQPGAGLLCFLLCRFLPARPKQTGTPIILLHGLGGYAPLIHFITTLLFLDRPVFIVDQPHVSFKLAFGIRSTAPPSMKDMVSSVHSMLAVHGFHPKEKTPAALIIAHSLGSALAAALTAGSPHSDAFQTVLIDPVSIRLYDAHLARAFAACRPRSDLSYLLRYFTTEMGVATYVARHFNAFDGGLLLHSGESSERNRTKVILARNDCLLPVNAIQRDCELTGVECEILENTDHGGFLTSLPVFLQVLRAVRKVSDAMTLEGAPQPVSMAAVEDVVKDMAEDTSAIVLVNPPAMGRITSRITHGSSPMACRPSLTQTNVPPCGISSGRAGRGRSRTMCGAPMMPCKSLRVAWGGVVPMEKTESLTRMVAVN